MTRRMIAGLIVVGLGAGIWLLWPRADSPGPTSTTQPIAVGTTSASSDSSVSTTVNPPSSSTTSSTSHVVATVEEAEAILRELWFGWFEGIYNQDEDRIREVVATQTFLDDARQAFTNHSLVKQPETGDLVFSELEVLRSDEACLVVWAVVDLSSLLGAGSSREGVDVLRWFDGSWRMATAWVYRGDLWEQDCESVLQSLS